MMHVSVFAAMVAVAVVLAFCGWLLLFRTGHILHLAHHSHRTSPRWIQEVPGHRVIFKPWYPTYLRTGGVFAWLLALSLLVRAALYLMR
ncbi:MAG TPA: hypothetical protein VME18_06460 [Acidobacteriaceae bacterium]|nr:hypothetical protein [Acidobacteriaceae bacterium]